MAVFPIISGSYAGGPAFTVIAGPFKSLAAAQKRASKLAREQGDAETLLVIHDPPNRFFAECWHVARKR